MRCHLCTENNKILPHLTLNEALPFPPLKLTANLQGHCNLRCQMCSIWKEPNDTYTEENFWKEARSTIFPFLKEVDMLAGEPLIQKSTFRLIDEISSVNSQCRWTITTNAHWKLNPFIESNLNKITFKNLIISVDGVRKETYEKIRKGGNFELIENNLNRLKLYNDARRKTDLGPLNPVMNYLVQKDNAFEVPEVFAFCERYDLRPFLTFLYEPPEFSLLSLEIKKMMSILDHWIKNLTFHQLMKSQRIITPLLEKLPPLEKTYYTHLLYEKKVSS